MAERFYCPEAASRVGGLLVLEGDEAHHLAKVRRIGVGQVVEVFDGRGFGVRAEVVELARGRVTLRPVGDPLPDRAALLALTLATAVPKGERFDWLVEKATEIGVARLVPLIAARSVVEPRDAKLDRLRRLVIEATKQCGRSQLMAIDPPVAWSEFVQGSSRLAPRLLGHPGGRHVRDWPRPRRRRRGGGRDRAGGRTDGRGSRVGRLARLGSRGSRADDSARRDGRARRGGSGTVVL